MSNEEVKTDFGSFLLALQLCLGVWQIGKLTPVGAVIKGVMGWLLQLFHYLLRPFGLSPTYTRLRSLPGHVYKSVRCHVTTAADQPGVLRERRDEISEIQSSYLGHDFLLQRRDGNLLFLNGKMSYYITDTIWYSLLDMGEAAPKTVFLVGYKEFWQQVATGGVMTIEDVLDRLILENHTIRALDNDLLIPVNLLVSEEKLLKLLNLVGLFLQTKQVYWQIPLLLSLTSALMEFNTSLRVWIYGKINKVLCCTMHLICDQLIRQIRRQVYALGNWVENLKPSNDIELRVVKGKICTLIGGGAKAHKEGAKLVQQCQVLDTGDTANRFNCKFPSCEFIDVGCHFDPLTGKCNTWASSVAQATVNCNRDEFMNLITFLSCIANNHSGSLKSCDSSNKMRVRGFRDSIICYAKNGFPPVYELEFENAEVN